MRTSTILLFALLLSACGVARPVLDRDNTKVEVKTVVERVVDTAWISLPVEVVQVETLDTVSVLENAFARSSAVVSSGVLQHSLETLPVSLPVEVEKEMVYRDSLVYRDRVLSVPVEVEKPLSLWQKFILRVGGVCLFLVAIYVAYFILHFIYNLKSFKL